MSSAASTLGPVAAAESDFPQYVYAPWVDGVPHSDRAKQVVELGRALANQTRLPLIGVGATKNQLPDDWGKLGYRTKKSSQGGGHGGSIEIHFWPSIDTFASLGPEGTHAFVLEWASFRDTTTYDLSGWARHNHAVHFDSKEVMAPALSDDALELYRRIDWNGNNGWFDTAGRRDALRDLRRLKELGEYDGADLLGYLLGKHSNRALRALLAIAEKA